MHQIKLKLCYFEIKKVKKISFTRSHPQWEEDTHSPHLTILVPMIHCTSWLKLLTRLYQSSRIEIFAYPWYLRLC